MKGKRGHSADDLDDKIKKKLMLMKLGLLPLSDKI